MSLGLSAPETFLICIFYTNWQTLQAHFFFFMLLFCTVLSFKCRSGFPTLLHVEKDLVELEKASEGTGKTAFKGFEEQAD